MTLMRIRLEVARTGEFPNGSSRHGYEFLAPLTEDGHMDMDAWQHVRDKCTVLRFWGDAPEEFGCLRHTGHGWRFDYDASVSTDDEPFFKLDQHRITPGAYLSIREHDGVQRPFKVIEIEPAAEADVA
ncbi:MAG: hypothetical protein KGL56_03050 [Alphaproteobacteria bacterium]|nr:hypothetical protein [Alphaproteobacteria bacterium]MDE2164204.1 hypothetical protein [Alphaproteobacteria bacterium]MDE2499146.1 hypothetical protein [Alphaproteobacteria bacterium]